MNRKLKTVLCAALVLLLMFSCCCVSFADEPMPVTVKAKAAVLMDVINNTGIYRNKMVRITR